MVSQGSLSIAPADAAQKAVNQQLPGLKRQIPGGDDLFGSPLRYHQLLLGATNE